MATKVYPAFLQFLLSTSTAPDLDNADTDVKIALVSSDYTYSDTHDFLDDITGILATTPALASKTVTTAAFDAADPTIDAASGGTAVAAIVYIDSGTNSTSQLICFIDKDADGDAISQELAGGDVTLTLNASGIVDLTA